MAPRIVALAGGSASGKSTVATGLAEVLGPRSVTISHDRYYHSLPQGHDPGQHNFDHPDALDNARLVADLARLRSGQPARLPRYDMATHRRLPEVAWDPVEPPEVVLLEGILVLAVPQLRDQIDLAVYVAAPPDVRLIRRIRRDIVHRGRALDDVLRQYEATVRPMHERFVAPSRAHADVHLDGTRDADALIAELLALL